MFLPDRVPIDDWTGCQLRWRTSGASATLERVRPQGFNPWSLNCLGDERGGGGTHDEGGGGGTKWCEGRARGGE